MRLPLPQWLLRLRLPRMVAAVFELALQQVHAVAVGQCVAVASLRVREELLVVVRLVDSACVQPLQGWLVVVDYFALFARQAPWQLPTTACCPSVVVVRWEWEPELQTERALWTSQLASARVRIARWSSVGMLGWSQAVACSACYLLAAVADLVLAVEEEHDHLAGPVEDRLVSAAVVEEETGRVGVDPGNRAGQVVGRDMDRSQAEEDRRMAYHTPGLRLVHREIREDHRDPESVGADSGTAGAGVVHSCRIVAGEDTEAAAHDTAVVDVKAEVVVVGFVGPAARTVEDISVRSSHRMIC